MTKSLDSHSVPHNPYSVQPYLIDLETQIEAFGIIYQKINEKKTQRRDSKELRN